MGLKDLALKKSYDSDHDDILDDFYIPALSASVEYERLAGFFSSTSLAVAARGIAGLISNAGRIKLLCGAKLRKEDVEEILKAKDNMSEAVARSALRELEEIEKLENKFVENHVRGLGWMMAHGFLDIRIAVVKDPDGNPVDYQKAVESGIFHQKVGILHDSDGNSISFSGSDNETAGAWTQNIEEFKIFCSWNESQREYLEADVNRFKRFWAGQGRRTEVYDIPEAVQKKLVEIAPDNIEKLELARLRGGRGERTIKFWPHQTEAIDRWLSNDKRCIFEMATGTGKTLAALGSLRKVISEGSKLVTVIACPYSHLITQWRENLERLDLKITTIEAHSGRSKWRDEMVDRLRDVANDIIRALVILTTHDTFYRDNFKDYLSLAKCELFLIADEVHGIGSRVRKSGLIQEYNYRLGLSATPHRWFDPEGTDFILSYFGVRNDTDIFIFSLEDAIKTVNPSTGETYLAPYEYKPKFTELTDEEIEMYVEETQKIAKSYYASKNKEETQEYFELLCFKRQKIIQNALNKYIVLNNILDNMGDVSHCLIYCSPEQIESVQEILNKRQIIQHKFTQSERTSPEKRFGGKSERDYILDHFAEGSFQALVAIKCLDEGVDIPQAKKAIILASTGNPREYIQRRGRLLRRFPGKEISTIYDVIVLPTLAGGETLTGPLAQLERKMVSLELRRYEEFARTSKNVIECIRVIQEIQRKVSWR